MHSLTDEPVTIKSAIFFQPSAVTASESRVNSNNNVYSVEKFV